MKVYNFIFGGILRPPKKFLLFLDKTGATARPAARPGRTEIGHFVLVSLFPRPDDFTCSAPLTWARCRDDSGEPAAGVVTLQ